MNEWMNESDPNIPPDFRLFNLISMLFTINWRFTSDELSIWAEQSQDLMLRSTVSFLIITHSSTFLSSFKLHFSLPTSSPHHLRNVHAGYLFVTDTLPISTIMEPPSVECQDFLIPTRSNSYSARINLRLKTHLNILAMRYKFLIDYKMTNRNYVFCYHQLCLQLA